MLLFSVVYTFTAGIDDEFKHMSVVGVLQGVQEATVDIVRLVHDNVQQLFCCLDGLAAFSLNGLQLFQRERVNEKHVAGDALRLQFPRHRVYSTQRRSVI